MTTAAENPDLAKLESMNRRFAPVELKADASRLSSGDRKALAKLMEAADVVDRLYLKQLWQGNAALYERLKTDRTPLGQARLRSFWLNKGPWSDLDGHTAFLPGVPARKPAGANFYPEDMTKAEFEGWLAKQPVAAQERAKGFFSVLRRRNGNLEAVPYSVEYKAELERMAALLREAAALTDNATLKRFLETRAKAFLSDDYYESDVAWMDLDAPLDITIGPYETYTDELFGYKAAFEAYVTVRDDAESAKLKFFADHLQDVENHLPIDAKYRNPKIGAMAPIRVVNQMQAAGDGAHGVMTAAFNLPNDERVVREKGSKRVMLKNVQEAKFATILAPIAKRALAAADQKDLSFDEFFTHILAHELTHGLGPHVITVGGRQTSPRKELKELYGAMEEAKADVCGLFLLQHLIDQGQYGGKGEAARATERRIYTTFLASSFRTLRFGLNEAHGKGMALQFNYLVDKGAFRAAGNGTFAVDFGKIKSAVRDLAHDLLTLEATGDYAGAKQMLDRLAVVRPEMKKTLDRMGDLPVDIAPAGGPAR